MITLKNVQKDGNRISAEYFPEDSTRSSRVVYDFQHDAFDGKLVGHDIETRNHLAHAKFALKEMAEGTRAINDCKIMWY